MDKEELRILKAKNRQEQEAYALGLVLLGKAEADRGSRSSCYKSYLLPCGHKQDLQPSHVRLGTFTCKSCFVENLISSAEERGLTYIGPLNNPITPYDKMCSVYFFKSCGHKVVMGNSNIKKGKERVCKICRENSLILSAKEHGLTFVEHINKQKSLWRFDSCGHDKVIAHSCILKKNSVCRLCQEEQYAKDAEVDGLTYLGIPKNGDFSYRHYKLPCGCERDIRMSHVRNSNWCCFIHENTHYANPSKVYLIKITNSHFDFLKFGFSHNPTERFKNFGLDSSFNKEIVFMLDFKTGYEALLFEKEIHKVFLKYRLCKNEMTDFMKNNGHTECYPTSILKVFQNYVLRKYEDLNGLEKQIE